MLDSEAWRMFGLLIHQDYIDDHPDFISGIPETFESLSASQQEEVRVILEGLLKGDYTNRELSEAWFSSGAHFFVGENDMRQFLSDILSSIISTFC